MHLKLVKLSKLTGGSDDGLKCVSSYLNGKKHEFGLVTPAGALPNRRARTAFCDFRSSFDILSKKSQRSDVDRPLLFVRIDGLGSFRLRVSQETLPRLHFVLFFRIFIHYLFVRQIFNIFLDQHGATVHVVLTALFSPI